MDESGSRGRHINNFREGKTSRRKTKQPEAKQLNLKLVHDLSEAAERGQIELYDAFTTDLPLLCDLTSLRVSNPPPMPRVPIAIPGRRAVGAAAKTHRVFSACSLPVCGPRKVCLRSALPLPRRRLQVVWHPTKESWANAEPRIFSDHRSCRKCRTFV